MQILLDNNSDLKYLYSQIQEDQKTFLIKFNKEELELEEKSLEISKLKLILSNNELDKKLKYYNEELKNFTLKIQSFNLHYDKQINILKNIIIDNILIILKEYSLENKIDLILDSNNYILSSNSIDITNLILENLNKIVIEFSFEKYE